MECEKELIAICTSFYEYAKEQYHCQCITEKEYNKIIKNKIDFLNNHSRNVITY